MKKQQRNKTKLAKKRKVREAKLAAAEANNDLKQAIMLHRDGSLDAAKAYYFKALETDTRNGDAWHMLGMAFYQSGKLDEAIECLGNAEGLLDSSSSFYSNLGVVLLTAKRFDDARRALEKARDLDPQQASIRSNLGVAYLEVDEPKLAESEFQKGLEAEPENVQLLSNLGNAFQRQGLFSDAESVYNRALLQSPNHEVWNNLGEVQRKLGKTDLAIDAFRKSIELEPSEKGCVNLGRAYMAARRPEEARRQLCGTIDRWPNSAIAYHYLGKLFAKEGHHEVAIEQYKQALDIDGNNPRTHQLLGRSEAEMGDIVQAINCMRKAVEIRPCLDRHQELLFNLSFSEDLSSQEILDEHLKWGNLASETITPYTVFSNDSDRERKLRIGYVSGDFRKHVVMKYFEPVIECHDRNRFEIFCYSELPTEVQDAQTARIKELSDKWRQTGNRTNQQVAELIRSDEVDILVDLAGHTAYNRLIVFAYKPAPIQATWLGYPNSTGLRQVDYRITNSIQDPIGCNNYHVEQLVRLQYGDCFRVPKEAPDVAACPARANGFVTFGCLHRPQKIRAGAIELWARVLHQVPNSRLLMFNHRFENSRQSEDFHDQLISLGIPQERFEIQHETGNASYLDVYNSIDIALDVFPWSGGTTSREALWMGVPVIGLMGNSRSSRATAAVLHFALLDDLIAKTQDQYVSIAVELAGDLDRLSSLRETMRERFRKTVGNAERLTAELENAYRAMWHRFCEERRADVASPPSIHAQSHLFSRHQSYQSDSL